MMKSFNAIINAIDDAVFIISPELIVEEVNKPALKLLNLPREKCIGVPCYELLFSSKLPPEECCPDLAAKNTDTIKIEKYSSHLDKHLSVSCTPAYDDLNQFSNYLAIVRDVSREHNLTNKLKSSEARYREIVDLANNAIIRMDKEGKLTFFNEFAEKLFHYKASEVLGKHVVGTIVPKKDSQGRDMKKMINGIILHPERFSFNENENITKEGNKLWMNWANRAFFDEEANLVDYVCIGTDITKDKQYLEDLRFMYQFSSDIIECPSSTNIYKFLGAYLHKVLPSCVFVVSSYDYETELLTVESVNLPRKLENAIFKYFDNAIVGRKMPASPEVNPYLWKFLSVGSLEVIEDWTLSASMSGFSTKMLQTIRKVYKIKDVYTMGLYWEGRIRGSVSVVLRKDDVLAKKTLLETLIKQSAVVLQRRQAIYELQREKQKFQTLIENAAEGMIVHTHQGEIIEVNKMLCLQLGYKRKDIIGMHISSVGPHYWNNYIKGGDNSSETLSNTSSFIKKDGNEIPVELRTANVEVKNVPSTLILLTDISVRLRNERKLKEQGLNLNALIENTHDFIWSVDKENNLLIFNTPFREMAKFAFNIEAKHGANLLLQLKKEEKEFWNDILDRTKNGESFIANRHYSLFDKTIDIEYNVNPIKGGGLAFFGRDISKQKEFLNALTDSEEKFRKAFDTSPDSINLNRLNDGLYIEVNKGFELLTGYHREEVIGKTSLDIDIWENPEDRKELVRGLIKDGMYSNLEAGFRIRNGEVRTCLMSASILNYRGDKVIISITRPIDELKRSEEELRKAKEKAEESDRLKSAFLANMSHEVRTPMNALMGFSELLNDEDVSKLELQEYSRIIQNKSSEVLEIVTDIIDISLIQSGSMQIKQKEIDLKGFLFRSFEECKELVNLYKARNIIQSIHFPDTCDAYRLVTDPVRLLQIIKIFYSNAWKYTREGSIELGFRMHDEISPEIYVKDTGIGINSEVQDKIFEAFYQHEKLADETVQGTGLGLSIAKSLAKMMAAEIILDSYPGRGSTFSLRFEAGSLKISEKNESLNENKPKVSDYPDLSRHKVLVVEDETSNYLFMETLLKRTGCEILWAKNGRLAIEMYENQDDISFIFMDIRMPEMNGFVTSRKIREGNKEIPIIATTAYAMSGDREKALESGCSHYLAKPVRLEEMLEVLRELASKG